MPKLTDDARYLLALEAQQRIAAEETRAFRQRLADRVVGLIAPVIDEDSPSFDERAIRKALSKYDAIYVEESMRYIENVLQRGGMVEAAKRIAEVAALVERGERPASIEAARQELRRMGLLDDFERRGLMPIEESSQVGLTDDPIPVV